MEHPPLQLSSVYFVIHLTIPLFGHSTSNVLAENMVKSFKFGQRKNVDINPTHSPQSEVKI